MTDGVFVLILNLGWQLGGLIVCVLVVGMVMKQLLHRKYAYYLWWAIPISYCYLFFATFLPKLPYCVIINRVLNNFPFIKLNKELILCMKFVWSVGIVVILLYLLCTYVGFRKKLYQSKRLRENIFISAGTEVPFSMGILKPRIYLPENLNENYYEAVILHERVHIARHDLLLKRIALLFLVINWFQPFAWVAYRMFVRDMEVSCDEAVLMNKTTIFRKNYAKALIEASIYTRETNAIVTGYGNGEIKERIKHISKHKADKPYKPLINVLIVLLCIVFVLLSIPAFWYIPKLFIQKPTNETNSKYQWEIISTDKTDWN